VREMARRRLRQWRLDDRRSTDSVVQDAFARELKRDRLYAENSKQFFFIMYRAIHNLLAEFLVAQDRQPRMGPLKEDEGAARSERPAQESQELRDALEELHERRPDLAHAVCLCEILECTYAEAGELMGLGVTATRRRVQLGKAWVLRELERRSR